MPALADPPTKPKQTRKRISPKQQQYAELRAQGKTQGEAALLAGYNSKTGAYRAERNPLVNGYLSEVRRNAAVRAGYVVATAMDEARDAMGFARETENATAYVKAVELRAKLSGLLIEKHEVLTVSLKEALDLAKQRAQSRLQLVSTDASNGALVVQEVEIEPKQHDNNNI